MQLTGLDRVLWAAGFIGYLILLCVLFLRQRAAQFPIFTALVTASLVKTLALYLVLHHGTALAYFYTYWSLAIVDLGLELGVVVEITSQVFRPLGTWAPDVRHYSIWLVFGSTLIASGLTWLASPPTDDWRQLIVIRGSLFSAALMSELFVGMTALSVSLGLPWRTHAARIAQGFGVYSILEILIEGANSLSGVSHQLRIFTALQHVRILMYQACVAYWIVTLWREAPRPKELSGQMRAQLYALQARLAYDLESIRSWRR